MARGVRSYLGSPPAVPQQAGIQDWRVGELVKLVRALADWRSPEAHRLLWRLATFQDIEEVEWPAAKALAMAKEQPESSLRELIDGKLDEADSYSHEEMSRHEDVLGNEIASLAWILPSFRGANDHAETQFDRIRGLCLDEQMSPLRGEMSLAQGLKLAVVNRRSIDRNIGDIRKLLFEGDPFPRFWHARLVLVQAMLVYACHAKDAGACKTADTAELQKQLRTLRRRELHPLVLDGIDLVLRGLQAVDDSSDGRPQLTRYMWIHEREAVRWVEQGKEDVARLAADAVMLSNMIYRLRKLDGAKADTTMARKDLPVCISKTSDRHRITAGGCSCAHELCVNERSPQPSPVTDMHARFSENFCREQVRLAELGSPRWATRLTYRNRHRLEKFWEEQAAAVGDRRTGDMSSSSSSKLPAWRSDEAYLLTLWRWWQAHDHGLTNRESVRRGRTDHRNGSENGRRPAGDADSS